MSAAEPLFCAYYKSVCSTAYFIVKNRHDAEDIASEVILKIISYANNSDRAYVQDAGAFVYTLTKNAALDLLRKKRRMVESDDDTPSDFDDGTERSDVFAALNRLPEQQRKIAQMFYYYDCKIKTIAAELGMTESAVKYHLSEIRKKLYEILKTD